jgi:SAM-dependent methyltransferase
MAATDIKDKIKKRYGKIATGNTEQTEEAGCCGTTAEVTESAGCCGSSVATEPVEEKSSCCGTAQNATSKVIGYSEDELSSLPDGANLGVGCGNPLALASVNEGDTVVDLGSGAGIDCFLAAKRVGDTGHVIGVDMTPQMLEKARANAEKGGYPNVEFREGEIENMPVDDNSVDVIISNCVINLSPDKPKVFSEIMRVLKPGGKFFVSDIVVTKELPEVVKASESAYTACVGGAILKDKYLGGLAEAGLTNIEILSAAHFPVEMYSQDPNLQKYYDREDGITREDMIEAAKAVESIKVTGQKPA